MAARNFPWSAIVATFAGAFVLYGCQLSDEQAAREAVIAAAKDRTIQFRGLRTVEALPATQRSGYDRHREVGAGICGQLAGQDEWKRYFIWERETGNVLFADESGVIPLGDSGGLMWRKYCTDR